MKSMTIQTWSYTIYKKGSLYRCINIVSFNAIVLKMKLYKNSCIYEYANLI